MQVVVIGTARINQEGGKGYLSVEGVFYAPGAVIIILSPGRLLQEGIETNGRDNALITKALAISCLHLSGSATLQSRTTRATGHSQPHGTPRRSTTYLTGSLRYRARAPYACRPGGVGIGGLPESRDQCQQEGSKGAFPRELCAWQDALEDLPRSRWPLAINHPWVRTQPIARGITSCL